MSTTVCFSSTLAPTLRTLLSTAEIAAWSPMSTTVCFSSTLAPTLRTVLSTAEIAAGGPKPRLKHLLSMLAPALRTRRSTEWPNEEALGAGAAEMVVTGEAVEIGGTWEVVAEVIAKAEGADAMVDAEENGDAEVMGAEVDGDDWDVEMVGVEDDWDAEMVGVEGTSRRMSAAALARAASTVTGAAGVPGGAALERITRTRRAGRRGHGECSSRRGMRRSPLVCARESARMRATEVLLMPAAEARVLLQPMIAPRHSSVLLNRPQSSHAHASGSEVLQTTQTTCFRAWSFVQPGVQHGTRSEMGGGEAWRGAGGCGAAVRCRGRCGSEAHGRGEGTVHSDGNRSGIPIT
jgi:hypothetical protein